MGYDQCLRACSQQFDERRGADHVGSEQKVADSSPDGLDPCKLVGVPRGLVRLADLPRVYDFQKTDAKLVLAALPAFVKPMLRDQWRLRVAQLRDESPYDSRKEIIEFRKKCGIGADRNVVRVTLKNGVTYIRANVGQYGGEPAVRAVYHAERALVRMLSKMIGKGVLRLDEIAEIYTERQPCSNPGQYCANLLRKFLGQHYPNVRISYTFASDVPARVVQQTIESSVRP